MSKQATAGCNTIVIEADGGKAQYFEHISVSQVLFLSTYFPSIPNQSVNSSVLLTLVTNPLLVLSSFPRPVLPRRSPVHRRWPSLAARRSFARRGPWPIPWCGAESESDPTWTRRSGKSRDEPTRKDFWGCCFIPQ